MQNTNDEIDLIFQVKRCPCFEHSAHAGHLTCRHQNHIRSARSVQSSSALTDRLESSVKAFHMTSKSATTLICDCRAQGFLHLGCPSTYCAEACLSGDHHVQFQHRVPSVSCFHRRMLHMLHRPPAKVSSVVLVYLVSILLVSYHLQVLQSTDVVDVCCVFFASLIT